MKRLSTLFTILTISLGQAFAGGGPANDNCAGALPISCGQTLTGSTASASADAGISFCGTFLNTAPGVWYTFVGDGSDVTVSTCNPTTDYDTKLGVFSGTCGSLACVDGNDDQAGAYDAACDGVGNGVFNRSSTVSFTTTCGETYYIYVTGFSAESGNYGLSLDCAGTGNPGGVDIIPQDITIQLDASGNYSFDTPLTPQTDAEQLIPAGTYTNSLVWQSFTATEDGILHSVSLGLGSVYSPTTGNWLAVDVLSGEGLAGSLLAQRLYLFPASFPAGLNEFILDETLDIVSGNQYTIVVYDSNGDPITVQKNDGDPYAGGINNTGAGSDFVFSTKILQRPEIDNGTTDLDGLASFGLSQTAFTCADAGMTIPVTLTATDNLGNSGACVANVTVEDDEDPVASCVPDSPTPTSGSYGFTGSESIPETGTVGSMTNEITVPDDFEITDINVNIELDHSWVGDLDVTLESPSGTVVQLVNRMGGNSCQSDGFSGTIDDLGPGDLTTSCAGNGSDITGIFFSTDPLSNFNGEFTAGPWLLTIVDNVSGDDGYLLAWSMDIDGIIPPTLVELELDASGNHTVDPNDIDNGSSDNCGVTLTASPASFTCADFGPQSITLTATDPSGNTSNCSTTVEVIDNIDPDAQCQDHTLVLDGSGAATLTTGDINNGSSDNCSIDNMALDQTAFNCSNLGANTVMLTVTDVFGNSSDCSATVTVEDNEFPVIVCPSDVTVCADDASGAAVSYAAVTGSDNCTFNITQTDASGLSSGDVFPLGPTTQEWTIEDVANNVSTCSFTITVNPTPVADYTASAACEGEATFFTDQSTIDASSSIVSWEWDMGDGSATIGLVDPIHAFADTGMYDVELVVTSAEGCTDTTTQSIQVGSVPSASFTVANGCEGDATVFTNTSTIDAGTLTYSWNFGDSNTSTDENPSHTYAIDGTYTVTLTVTSDNGCEDSFTGSVEVYDSPTALFSASTECEGFATAFTNLSTGDGTLTHSWDFGDSNSSTDENPTHTYAAAGDYTVVLTVTNDNSCVSTHTVVVTVNSLPTVDFTFNDVCEGTPTDFVNASDAGTYAWDFGDSNSSTLEDVSHTYAAFGTYDVTLTVTDVNFCINSATQQVEVFDLPDFTLTPSEVLCYGEATGSIVANPQGTPSFPWDFSLNGGTPQINDTFLDLPAGDYDVTVVDDNGCEFMVSTTITQPSDTLGIDVSALVDVLCNGESTGEINIMGTGGTAPYTYSVNAGTPQATGDFSGLPAGTHDIQILDFNSCVFDTTITLTEPDTLILGTTNTENLLCNGDFSGEIAVAGTGGVAPYEYNLDGGAYSSDSTFIGLAAGDYVVGVLDANGCTDTVQVTLTEPGILMLSLLSLSDANCFGEANGSIEVGASSGTPDYQYSLDGVSFQGSGLFEGLAAGTYTVTVMDANGCTAELTETIFEPSLLTIETNSVPVACFGELTGEIEIIADGGSPDYMYSIDEGATFEMNGGLFSGLVSGEYIAVVQDDNGCTASEGVVISQPAAAFDLTASVEDALCLDSASGVVTLIGNGGTPTYTYSSDNSSFVSDNIFEGFAAGSYTLYAQDVNGCADSVAFVVDEPASSVEITSVLLNNPACPNEASGTASVTATGGTPGYMYSGNAGNTFQASSIIEGLNGGNHLIVVQDVNGCTATDTITLVSPELLDIEVDTLIGVACEGDLNGEIHVVASGGTPSYNYTLNGGSLQSNGDYTNLSDGVYTIEIMDVNGCTFSEDFEVTAAQMQPVADFTWTSSGTAVLFTNNSSFGDTYLWEFGDDSTSTEENPVHVYAEDGSYDVTLTVTNECGETTITRIVNTIFTGIEEAEEVSFNLFPNPTTYDLNLQSNKNIDDNLQIEIVSSAGQLVRTQQVAGMNSRQVTRIDINGLSQGIYYLRLLSDKQQTVLRFDIIK